MSLSKPGLDELSPSELLHIHHGCMVAIRTSLAVGDDDVSEFVVRAEAVMSEMHNRVNPHAPVEVPEHRRKRSPGRPRKQA